MCGMTRPARQIPRGEKTEGRTPFRRGCVLRRRRGAVSFPHGQILTHCGITAKKADFAAGAFNSHFPAVDAPCTTFSSSPLREGRAPARPPDTTTTSPHASNPIRAYEPGLDVLCNDEPLKGNDNEKG